MFDAPVQTLQRARGRAEIRLSCRGIERLYQEGSAKAFLPRTDAPDPEAVFLNTAGGLTGGDALAYRLDLGPGARATATTQTAERVYRAGSGVARMAVRLAAGEGASLDWLPQETILFDGAGLHRDTEIALGRGARCLMAEIVVLGRAAMGETVTRLDFTDRRRVTREGRPVLVEPLALDAASLAATGPAGLSGARALATLALVDQGAEDALEPVRALIDAAGVRAHASAWDGRLVLRALGAEALPVRRLVARVAEHLRRGPMPRVWQV